MLEAIPSVSEKKLQSIEAMVERASEILGQGRGVRL
jgi:hypothetical protein